MLDPTFPLAPIFNLIAALLVLLTLMTNNYKSPYDRGVIMLKGWVLLGLLKMSFQTIIWRDSYELVIPIYCDISSHLDVGLSIAVPACSLIMTRRLWLILDGKPSHSDSKLCRAASIDYFFGLAVPAIHMILYYVVQGGRFEVLESYGCGATYYQSGVTIILFTMWPVLLPLTSVALYCWRIALYLYRHWRMTNSTLSGRKDWDSTRYSRLLAISLLDILLSLPVAIVVFIADNFLGPRYPFWPGWAVVHRNWKPLGTPASVWQQHFSGRFVVYWNEWVLVVYAIALFALFGVAPDTMDRYRRILRRARSCLPGAGRWTTAATSTSIANLPVGMNCQPSSFRHEAEDMGDKELILDTLDGPGDLHSITIDMRAE